MIPFWDNFRSQKMPENAQRNEIAVTFDQCLGLTWFRFEKAKPREI